MSLVRIFLNCTVTNSAVIQHKVSSELTTYISAIREYQFVEPDTLKLNPEGCIELVFQLDGLFEQKVHDSSWKSRPQVFVGGLHSKSFEVKGLSANSKLLSVIFQPLGARQFFKESLSDYKNSIVDLHDIDGLKEVEFQNLEVINPEIIERTFSKLFRDQRQNIVDLILEKMVHHKGNVNITEICSDFKIGRSYLHKLFSEQVGMSPKEYSRVLRVNHCFKLMEKGATANLTELGYLLGYYDQSHFIRDFKMVTGQTPAAYLKTL